MVQKMQAEGVDEEEQRRVFNLGIGMCAVVPAGDAARTGLPLIGEIIADADGVVLDPGGEPLVGEVDERQDVALEVLPRGRGVLVALHVVAGDEHAGDALGQERPRDGGERDGALGLLAARHGDRAVPEQLVGDVHAGRDGRLDRELAAVEVGAVADVLEHVGALGERRLADPGRALPAQRRQKPLAYRSRICPISLCSTAPAGRWAIFP